MRKTCLLSVIALGLVWSSSGMASPSVLTLPDGTMLAQGGVSILLKDNPRSLSIKIGDGPFVPVTGDVSQMDLQESPGNLIDEALGIAVINSPGGTLCPGGTWTVIDLANARATGVMGPDFADFCGEGTHVAEIRGGKQKTEVRFVTTSGNTVVVPIQR